MQSPPFGTFPVGSPKIATCHLSMCIWGPWAKSCRDFEWGVSSMLMARSSLPLLFSNPVMQYVFLPGAWVPLRTRCAWTNWKWIQSRQKWWADLMSWKCSWIHSLGVLLNLLLYLDYQIEAVARSNFHQLHLVQNLQICLSLSDLATIIHAFFNKARLLQYALCGAALENW